MFGSIVTHVHKGEIFIIQLISIKNAKPSTTYIKYKWDKNFLAQSFVRTKFLFLSKPNLIIMILVSVSQKMKECDKMKIKYCSLAVTDSHISIVVFFCQRSFSFALYVHPHYIQPLWHFSPPVFELLAVHNFTHTLNHSPSLQWLICFRSQAYLWFISDNYKVYLRWITSISRVYLTCITCIIKSYRLP